MPVRAARRQVCRALTAGATLSPLAAGAFCATLTAADVLARGWRIQWLLRGLGVRTPLREAVIANTLGDAAAALTPLRVGGQPGRVAALAHAGVPPRHAIVAVAAEAAMMYPVAIACGALLAGAFAADWWASVGPRLAAVASRAMPWALPFALSALLAVLAWRRLLRRRSRAASPRRSVLADLRGMPRWPLAASVPLSLVNVLSRVAILPVLALTLDPSPPLGATLVGSYALLYGQLVLPTPSGAGAVDFAMLSGLAGDLHGDARRVLLAWRGFTTGAFLAAAALLLFARFGLAPLTARHRRARALPSPRDRP